MMDLWVAEYNRKLNQWHVTDLAGSLHSNTNSFITATENDYKVVYYGSHTNAELFVQIADEARSDHRFEMTDAERKMFMDKLAEAGLLGAS